MGIEEFLPAALAVIGGTALGWLAAEAFAKAQDRDRLRKTQQVEQEREAADRKK